MFSSNSESERAVQIQNPSKNDFHDFLFYFSSSLLLLKAKSVKDSVLDGHVYQAKTAANVHRICSPTPVRSGLRWPVPL